MDKKPFPTSGGEKLRTKVAMEKSEKESNEGEQGKSSRDLLPLFRLLMREPPQGHDFKTCPLCKHYGIDRI
jgi:hypothetical protein